MPSRRRPVTSRPMPMILAAPVVEIPREIAVVLLVIGRRHQHADVPADHFGLGIAEQPLGSAVERLDACPSRR